MFLQKLCRCRPVESMFIYQNLGGIYQNGKICTNMPTLNKTTVLLFKNTTTRVRIYQTLQSREFHKSKPVNALPPILWALLRPVLKFAAVVTGRGLRKWWASLPTSKRQYFLNEIKKHRQKFIGAGVISSGVVYLYYVTHLVEDPITKRKKFLIFTEKQIRQMAMVECEVVLENYKGKIVTSGYQHSNVLKVAQNILQANIDLPGTKRQWQVLIVNDNDTKNAFVLPSGHIFIFTGMLLAVSNEDQLAAILAHEMAHALLCHSAEIASTTHLLEMLMLLPLVALWTLLPDSIALFSHYFTEYISSVLFRLPFSRSLETEADTVGLEMIAKACYDPRQASLFWQKMEKMAVEQDVEWLSTHPSHKTRYNTLDGLMPKAFQILSSHCIRSDMDPKLSRKNKNGPKK